MRKIKEKIIQDLQEDISKRAQALDQLSGAKTTEQLAEIVSDRMFGCPSYYGFGLEDKGCKNKTQWKCKKCWLRTLTEVFD